MTGFSGVLVLQARQAAVDLEDAAEALRAAVIGECIMASLSACPSRCGAVRFRSESSWGVHDPSDSAP